jgi:hypothetical protein
MTIDVATTGLESVGECMVALRLIIATNAERLANQNTDII